MREETGVTRDGATGEVWEETCAIINQYICDPDMLTLGVAGAAVLTSAPCAIDPPGQCAWYNASLPFAQRRNAVLAALTTDEKFKVITTQAVDRLHLISDGFNEAAHGVAWTGRATVFPCSMGMAATWNVSLVHEMGRVVAHEALAKKWRESSNALSFFAPNINIVRDVRWGRAQETYGEDPTLTSALAVAYVSGMQHPNGSGTPLAVRNVAKHFVAYNLESNFAVGGTDGQYRLSYDANVSRADLLQTFSPAFEAVVRDADVGGVMCAYNSINGTPICANPALLEGELRGRLGFDGVVVTDCGAIGFMTTTHHWNHTSGVPYTPLEATVATFNSGVDVNCGGAYGDNLAQGYAQSLIAMETIDKSVGRIIDGYLALGLLEDSAHAARDRRRQVPMSVVDSPPHRALAKQAAAEGVVLLKNDGVLPLGGNGMAASAAAAVDAERVKAGRNAAAAQPSRAPRTPLKLAVVGPNANRTMTLTSNYAGCKARAGGPILPTCTFVNPLEGIRAAARASAALADDVPYAQGVDIDTNGTAGIAAAAALASKADVAIFVGGLITCQELGEQCQEAEARDRSTPVGNVTTSDVGRDYGIGLPGKQLQMIQALAKLAPKTRVVVVLMSGSAVAVPWAAAAPGVSAIVQHFYAGVLGGEALADVLVGTHPPAGRLPVMVPESEAQLPKAYLDQSMMAGMGRTHRYFKGAPLYPFGFGLGYATFEYSDVAIGVTPSTAPIGAGATARLRAGGGTEALRQELAVSVTVRNRGEFAAAPSAEVVMVFATPRALHERGVAVPRQTLLGFEKVLLEPGEARRLTMKVPAARLRLVSEAGSHEVLRGLYELHVGGRAPLDGGRTSDASHDSLVKVQAPLRARVEVV